MKAGHAQPGGKVKRIYRFSANHISAMLPGAKKGFRCKKRPSLEPRTVEVVPPHGAARDRRQSRRITEPCFFRRRHRDGAPEGFGISASRLATIFRATIQRGAGTRPRRQLGHLSDAAIAIPAGMTTAVAYFIAFGFGERLAYLFHPVCRSVRGFVGVRCCGG